MQDVIEPIHRLTLSDLAPAGVERMVASPVSPTVFVQVNEHLVDPLLVAMANWVWVLSIVGTIPLLFVAWRVYRIVSRPQRRGVPHCRRCNYDLSASPALAMAEGASGASEKTESTVPVCPECGLGLTARTIVSGRRTRRRLVNLAPLAAWVLVTAACAVALAMGWRPVLPACPSHWATRLAIRLNHVPHPRLMAFWSTIYEVDLATGTTVRTVYGPAWFVSEFTVTPDGESLLIASSLAAPIRRVSIRDGRETASIGPFADRKRVQMMQRFCGFTPDGAAAYIVLPAPGTLLATRVERWSLVDNSLTPVAVIPTTQYSRGGEYARACPIVVPGSPERVFSLPTFFERMDSRTVAASIHSGPSATPQATLVLPQLSFVPGAAMTSNGSRIYVAGDVSLMAMRSDDLTLLGAVDLPELPAMATGVVAIDHADRLVAVDGARAMALRDTVAKIWLTSLGGARRRSFEAISFSADDRFVIALLQGMPSQSAPPPAVSKPGELLIWDISELRAALPPPQP